MNNDLSIFKYAEQEVRIVMIENEPWFVATDICACLGLENVSRAVASIDKEDAIQCKVTDKIGRQQAVYCVNEGGLYNLIFKSEKEEAKIFKRWVTHEVLPSIRKTGKYELQKDSLTAMTLMRQQLDYLIEHEKQLREHKEKLENHETRLADIEAQITTVNKDYLSLAGYYGLKKQVWGLSNPEAQKVGKDLKKASTLANMPIIRIHDTKYGEVNGYHKDILAQVLGF